MAVVARHLRAWLVPAFLGLFALAASMHLQAQEALFDAVDEDAALPQWDAIEYYREQPLCLLAATATDVARIPGMSLRLASQVLRVVAARPRWDVAMIADSLCLGLAQQLVLQLCTTTRCDTAAWKVVTTTRIGSRLDATHRLAMHYGSWYVHGLLARTPEDRTTVGHAAATIGAAFKGTSIALGDVALRVGTGLLMAGTGMSRSRNAITAMQDDAMTMRPWTSSIRYGSVRGATIMRTDSIGPYALHTMAAASYRPLAARQDTNAAVVSVLEQTSVFGLRTSTTHTTLHEALAGASVYVDQDTWHFGLSAWRLTYSMPLATSSARDVHGTGGTCWSVYGGLSLYAGTLAWEVARDVHGNTGLVAQSSQRFHNLRIGTSARWLPAGFRSPYGSAPTDASAPSNEVGIGISGSWVANARTRVEALVDLRRTFDRTYMVPRPVRAVTFDATVLHRLPAKSVLHGRLFADVDDDAIRLPGVARVQTARRTRTRARAAVDAVLAKPLTLTCRIDASLTHWSAHRMAISGAAIMLRSTLTLMPWLRVTAQATTYATPGIDAALYMAESPMPGVMRAVTLVGNGSRTTLAAHLVVTPTLSVWASWTASPRERRADVMLRWTLGGVNALPAD